MAIPTLATTSRTSLTVSGLTLPALAGFGLAIALQGVAPLCAGHGSLLIPGFLACAGVQTVAGLLEWRRQHPLVATVLVAFALFWCSQLPQLLHPADQSATLAGVGYLSLWGIFALLLAGHAPHRPLALTLYGFAATLLLQASALASGFSAFHWVAAACALFSGGCAVFTALAGRERSH